MRDSFKIKLKMIFKGWGFTILIVLIVATSFKSAIADWNVVPTGSMNPTIVEGDRIFVNKLAYDLKVPYTTWHIAEWGDPQRGEVVVFYSPADGKRLVKRVVGLPGDTIEMRDNQLIINRKRMEYGSLSPEEKRDLMLERYRGQYGFIENLNPRRHPIMISPGRYALRSFGPVIIPEESYFMMGDNRDNSADSRYFGFVDRSLIVGRATAIVISLNIMDRYQPRWERFFTRLQ